MIRTLLTSAASLFEPATGSDAGERRFRWLLIVILIAGTLVRFWGLGDIGLHREDEDTSALPVLHILEDGTPRFPSGMYYARAIAQSYMMAASVWAFGNTEWALRLPSALCGVLLIGLAFLLGRRFLRPIWNLVFTAVIAFLPSLIVASQTARMYIFLLACLAAYAILIFRWERTGRVSALCWAVLMMIIGLQFQPLAVFGAFMLFYPALLHGKVRSFWQAGVAFVAVIAACYAVNQLVGQYYPQRAEGYFTESVMTGPTATRLVPPTSLTLLAAAILAGCVLAWQLARRIERPGPRWAAAASLVLAMIAQVLLQYHLALLLLIIAAVLALRHGRQVLPTLLRVILVCSAIAIAEGLRMRAAGIDSLTNIVGVMVGSLSIWPYIRISDYSIGGLLLCGAGVVAALWQLTKNIRIPDYWLMFVLWGWLPLLMVGAFAWNPPPRYTIVTLLPMLLASVATLQWLSQRIAATRRNSAQTTGLAIIGAMAIVNPVVLADSVHAGYNIHPDHVGAAQFVLAQHPGPRDLLLAEDVIVQTYYLGKLDYWLLSRQAAADFVENVNGEWRDIYTHSLICGSAEELQQLIDNPDRGDIYIIGSGENQSDGRRYMRGEGINRLLTSGNFPVVYVGRDQLTRVWKIPPVRGSTH